VSVLFDTDILIWIQRGSRKAARLVDRAVSRSLSIYSYMELMQSAQNRDQHRQTKGFLKSFGFDLIPLSENIGHRAAIYIEEYTLSHGLRAGDAIIAATAVENDLLLISGNRKHFIPIKKLKLKLFKP
jgi:predicted nucleic acid-binding protein